MAVYAMMAGILRENYSLFALYFVEKFAVKTFSKDPAGEPGY